MKIMELKLNKAKVNHLLGLLEINEREGYYYGNKEHYLKRHNALKTELKLLITDVVVPKGTLCDVCGSENTITVSHKGENCDWCNPL